MTYICILNCEVYCVRCLGNKTKIWSWGTVQMRIFCSIENLTHLVQTYFSRKPLVVTQCHKINFKSATLTTKLHTRMVETRDRAQCAEARS